MTEEGHQGDSSGHFDWNLMADRPKKCDLLTI